ncbi:MAG: carbamoyltransferase [Solirubrobacterales bacterium]
MRVLGISAYRADSAAALVDDGGIVAAAQEERFTRKKQDAGFPQNAIRYCLAEAGCRLADLDLVVFHGKPLLEFERQLATHLSFAPRGVRTFKAALPKLFQKGKLRRDLLRLDPGFDAGRQLFSAHHLSHAASAFFPSPFQDAAVLTIDGAGEWATTSLAMGTGNRLEITREIHFPHSLGLFYSAFTYYTGFKVNSGEYKMMGLAPYGSPLYARRILDHLIDVKDDGSFRLNQDYFDDCAGLTMTGPKFAALFGQPVRRADTDPLTQFHMDIAASAQAVTEEVVLKLARAIRRDTGARNLCLAGGVALNCVANGKLVREGIFDNVWVQPAAGDAGGALGAALAGTYIYGGLKRQVGSGDAMAGSYLGPQWRQDDIEHRLTMAGARFAVLTDDAVIETTAQALAEQKAIGWMQGRMEFGPRALGNRSILGDPRSPTMQKTLNLKVKYRESFRPFAPSVLSEDVGEWFELGSESPYMLVVAPVRESHRRAMTEEERALFGIDKLNVPRSSIPAVTHVDYSARIQTVHADTNPRYHALISAFKRRTGCGVVVNTSFNVRGEPIVNTPEDAFRCFMGSEIDVLVVGNCYLIKEEQDPALKLDYKNAFELD